MINLIVLMFIQCALLALSQVFFKLGLNRIIQLSFRWSIIPEIMQNYYFWLAGIVMLVTGIIWMYVLKKTDFSIAYPMVSITFIFGLLASVYIFHENVPITRWLGVGIIILGILLVTQK